ncbi:MAG: hypothetical protein G8237_03180 [Magnetococcales bacterium]|nr:hypothetical protein [Magnetococcales bacterium]NGZ05338.1 hypothetical protein [Magnetococcales bacterium]
MMHSSEGHRSAENMARMGTFFVATRADWQAWLDHTGVEEQERVLVTRKMAGRGWSARRGKLSGQMG